MKGDFWFALSSAVNIGYLYWISRAGQGREGGVTRTITLLVLLTITVSATLTLTFTSSNSHYSYPYPPLLSFTPHFLFPHLFKINSTLISISIWIFLGEREKVRSLYSRLLERTSHVKVWLSYALYEASEAVSLLSPPPPPSSSEGETEGNLNFILCLYFYLFFYIYFYLCFYPYFILSLIFIWIKDVNHSL